MYVRATFVGGIFTILAILLIIFLVVQSLLMYSYDNILETKSLIPLPVMVQNYPDATGDIEIKLIFGEYGGMCIAPSDDTKCHREITTKTSGMNG
jgi:hypothetical protein